MYEGHVSEERLANKHSLAAHPIQCYIVERKRQGTSGLGDGISCESEERNAKFDDRWALGKDIDSFRSQGRNCGVVRGQSRNLCLKVTVENGSLSGIIVNAA